MTGADVQLIGYRITRVSRLDGPIVRELGRTLKQLVKKKLDDQEPKIVEKANKQIEKNRDSLTLSLADFGKTAWSELMELTKGDKPEGED